MFAIRSYVQRGTLVADRAVDFNLAAGTDIEGQLCLME